MENPRKEFNKLETLQPNLQKEEVVDNYLENIEKSKREQEQWQYEQELVNSDSENIGINFDQSHIINPKNLWSEEKLICYFRERDGEISSEIQSIIDSNQTEEILLKRSEKEYKKIISFYEYLEGFKDLKKVRINPAGELSPLSPSMSIESKSGGDYEVKIIPEFIEQIRKMQEQVRDLTLVIPFYDHRREKGRESNIPETKEQTDRYIAICIKCIEEFGDNIQLEIGNETNVSKNTGAMFRNKLQHASHVDPIEYGEFFFMVAREIKKKYPKIRLSVAGIACFDPIYLKNVLLKINELQKENKMDSRLVDTISFHPYRDNPEQGSIRVENGKFTINGLDYEEQVIEMKKIAEAFEVDLRVGEINFSFSDPENKNKLQQAISLTTQKEVSSLIYPGVNVC